MKLKTLLIINAIIALIYGIGELLIPTTMFSIYGVAYNPEASLMAQYFGLTLIAIGLLCWFARNITDSETLRAIALALLISNTIGIIVSVMGTVSGVMSTVGWSAVVIYLFLAMGYAYFLIKKLSGSSPTSSV